MRQETSIRFGGPITPAVKALLIINGAVFFVQKLLSVFFNLPIEQIFGLSHDGIFSQHMYWQLFTYMFFHGGIFHILLNMLALWMFAGDLENRWGTKRFTAYYLLTGLGAGFFIAAMNAVSSHLNPAFSSQITIGASGAVFGLLLAYGVTWPNREVLLYFILPIKMKYLVLIFGLIEFFGTMESFTPGAGNISHIGHLGGIFTGLLIFAVWRARERKLSVPLIFRHQPKRHLHIVNNREKAKEIIDRLLDKIARDGMASLSSSERKDLEWARKNYYPDNDETIH